MKLQITSDNTKLGRADRLLQNPSVCPTNQWRSRAFPSSRSRILRSIYAICLPIAIIEIEHLNIVGKLSRHSSGQETAIKLSDLVQLGDRFSLPVAHRLEIEQSSSCSKPTTKPKNLHSSTIDLPLLH